MVQILRHNKIAIMMEIYTKVVSSATREALRKLGDQLGPEALLHFTAAPACETAGSMIGTGL